MSAVPDSPNAAPGCQFASDNTAGICPEAWSAMQAANIGRVPSYGVDALTQRACDLIRALFQHPKAQVFFVFSGTAANALALAACCQSYHGVICHEHSHVDTDECGAPEFFSNGSKLLPAGGDEAKLTPVAIEALARHRTDLHFPKARALSLSQSTELGALYSRDELAAIGALSRELGLVVHMDGARFANAAAALCHDGVEPADITWRAGVDVLCFGGTKNGAQTTEAVVFFNPTLANEFEYRCKQAGQLSSKMRFLSSQWIGLLESGAWLRHAAHANAMAARLARELGTLGAVQVLNDPPAANAVFVQMPASLAAALRARGWLFYEFAAAGAYRLMCAWDTTAADVALLAADLKRAAAAL